MPKAKKTVMVGKNNQAIMDMFRDRGGFKLAWDIRARVKPDILVFPGGADLNPKLYGEDRLSGTHYVPVDDNFDISMYEEYKDVPKIGICRGAQFLNVMSGGKLWQDVDGHRKTHLAVDVLLDKKPILVTSTHHQMMIPDEKSGEVLAFANEATNYYSGIPREKPPYDTEVVWYEHTQSLCFQPHPEYSIKGTTEHTDYFFDLVDYFFN